MQAGGKAVRLNTFVDIPVEIGLPYFIQDGDTEMDSLIHGNFKLSLQSMVCHRGKSVDSGHYIAVVRRTEKSSSEKDKQSWWRFDDLASQRITPIDVDQALHDETPYLLFYQIMPIDGDPGNITAGEHPPSYDEPQHDSGVSGMSTSPERRHSIVDSQPPSARPSLDIPTPDEVRGRTPADTRRPSLVAFNEKLAVINSGSTSGGETKSSKSDSADRAKRRRSGVFQAISSLALSSKETPSTQPSANPEVVVHIAEDILEEPAQKNTALPKRSGTLSKHGREKSKPRRDKGSSKTRAQKPDRECVVM